MRTVQQLYDDKRDKVIIDIRDKEEYDKETMDSAVQYFWEGKNIVNMKRSRNIQMLRLLSACITYITAGLPCILICMTEDIMPCSAYGWTSVRSRRTR